MDQLLIIFECYDNPDQIIQIIESRDYSNKNIYYYFDKYELLGILNTKIMDKFFQDKWSGRLEIQNQFFDFSTSYMVYQDQQNNFN